MRKGLCLIALVAVGAASQASFNFNIATPYTSAVIPGTGSTLVTFSGTVDVLLPTWDVTSFAVELPGLVPTGPYLGGIVDSSFAAYVASAAPGVDYTGGFFSIVVPSTATPGDYFYNGTLGGPLSHMEILATDGAFTETEVEFYGVTLRAVPEPATFALLGLGAAALLRRRRA